MKIYFRRTINFPEESCKKCRTILYISLKDIRIIRIKALLRTSITKGFSSRDITISYRYMNAPLNFFNELSMSKH